MPLELIGVVGASDSYCDKAADGFLKIRSGATLRKVFLNSIAEAFARVEAGALEWAVVPMENLLDGHVPLTSDLLYRSSSARISAEVYLPVKHCLAVSSANSAIASIISFPDVLAQCRQFISRNYHEAALLNAKSPAEAMESVARQGLDNAAAIGDAELAGRLGLKVLARDIGDEKNNETRYVVISTSKSPEPTGKDKTTAVLFDHADEPGLLRKMLEPFERNRINLTRIESRPSLKRLGEYVFHIDLQAHEQDARLKGAFDSLSGLCKVKLLGSYPDSSPRATRHQHP